MKYTVVIKLRGPLAEAVAVEWTDQDTPEAGAGWQPCVRLEDGSWRMSSRDPEQAVHWREPGPFENIAIRYRLTEDGPWSPPSTDRKSITIVAVEEEDPDPGEPALPVAPVLITSPTLAGTGTIGTEVRVDPGQWGGDPAPEIALQWLRDGTEIEEATDAAYVPGPADDRTELACAVTASNAGGSERVVTAALPVRYAAPEVTGELFDEVFDEGSGLQTVEAAPAFTGDALTYSVEGAGSVIDEETGTITIPTEEPIAGETVTVTAENSGGTASTDFMVTVEALDAPAGLEIGPENAELLVTEGPNGEWYLTARVTDPEHPMSGEMGGIGQLRWSHSEQPGDPLESNAADKHPEFANSESPFFGCWWCRLNLNGAEREWADKRNSGIGAEYEMVFAWSPDDPARMTAGEAEWIGWGARFAGENALVVYDPRQGDSGEDRPPLPADPDVTAPRLLGIRHEAEAKAGFYPGEGEQLMRSMYPVPGTSLIYKYQDMGLIWRYDDKIRRWQAVMGVGHPARCAGCVAVDPHDPHHVVSYGQVRQSNEVRHLRGFYTSIDGGAHWEAQHIGLQIWEVGSINQCISPDGTSATNDGGKTRSKNWVAAISNGGSRGPSQDGSSPNGDGIYTNTNFGRGTWNRLVRLPLGTYGLIRGVYFDPGNGRRAYMTTEGGFWRLDFNASLTSVTLTRLDGRNGLPSGGHWKTMEFGSSSDFTVCRDSSGIWRCQQAGGEGGWTRIFANNDSYMHAAHPLNRNHMIVLGRRGGHHHVWRSRNALSGGNFTQGNRDSVSIRPGAPGWHRDIGNNKTNWVAPVSDTPETFMIAGNTGRVFRSDNVGDSWEVGDDGFTGFNGTGSQNDAFHPSDPDRWLLSTEDRRVWVTANAGEWYERSDIGGDVPEWSSCWAAVWHLTRSEVGFASLGRGNHQRLFRTTDGFNTWQTCSTRNNWRLAIFCHKQNPDVIYCGDEMSLDGGATWNVVSWMNQNDAAFVGMSPLDGDIVWAVNVNGNYSRLWKGVRTSGANFNWTLVSQESANFYRTATNRRELPAIADYAEPHVFWTIGQNHQLRRVEASNPSKPDINDIPLWMPGLPEGTTSGFKILQQDPRFPDVMYAYFSSGGAEVQIVRTTDKWSSFENMTGAHPRVSGGSMLIVSPHTGDLLVSHGVGIRVFPPPYAQRGTIFERCEGWGVNVWTGPK